MQNKRFLTAIVATLATAGTSTTAHAEAPKASLPVTVYAENGGPMPWIPSGYMGNHSAIKMSADSAENPHSGKTCLKVEYKDSAKWGGVVWQSPANDWEGQKPGGWDLTGAKTLSFWARGANGGETVSFAFGGGGQGKPYPDSAKGNLEKVKLTADWKQYTIDLSGKDLSQIKNGFSWVLGAEGSPVTFFLDDIKYE